ncbi:unnamed protein product, partial [Mesorhabditis belari]|uniref:C2H2-type domain-containing protein n=1 Tax=Mesorhabditis belari TaxID=2138241 RepID=A0AAF3E8U9_9BILA
MPSDNGDHAYLPKSDFELLVNSTHNYFGRVPQAEQSSEDIDHAYALWLPGDSGINNEMLSEATTSRQDWIEENEGKQRVCKWRECTVRTMTVDEAEMHLDSHLQPKTRSCEWIGCPKMGRAYAARYLLRTHMRSHIDSLPFSCDECGKQFRTREREKLHRRALHSNEDRRYKCESCESRFYSTAERRAHFLRAHLKQRFLCDLCGRPMATKAVLLKHKKIRHSEMQIL